MAPSPSDELQIMSEIKESTASPRGDTSAAAVTAPTAPAPTAMHDDDLTAATSIPVVVTTSAVAVLAPNAAAQFVREDDLHLKVSTNAIGAPLSAALREPDTVVETHTTCSTICLGSDTSAVAAAMMPSRVLGEASLTINCMVCDSCIDSVAHPVAMSAMLDKPKGADTAVMHEDEKLLVVASDVADDHSFFTDMSAMPITLAALVATNMYEVLLPLKLLLLLSKSKEHGMYSDLGCTSLQLSSLLPWDPGEKTEVSRDSVLNREITAGACVKQLDADLSGIPGLITWLLHFWCSKGDHIHWVVQIVGRILLHPLGNLLPSPMFTSYNGRSSPCVNWCWDDVLWNLLRRWSDTQFVRITNAILEVSSWLWITSMHTKVQYRALNIAPTRPCMLIIVGHLLNYSLEADDILLLIPWLHVPCFQLFPRLPCTVQGYINSNISAVLANLNGRAEVLRQNSCTRVLTDDIHGCWIFCVTLRGNTQYSEVMHVSIKYSLLQSKFELLITGNIISFCRVLVQWEIPWTISLVSRKSWFQYRSLGCEPYDCQNFQWTIAWSLNYQFLLLSLQTPSACASSECGGSGHVTNQRKLLGHGEKMIFILSFQSPLCCTAVQSTGDTLKLPPVGILFPCLPAAKPPDSNGTCAIVMDLHIGLRLMLLGVLVVWTHLTLVKITQCQYSGFNSCKYPMPSVYQVMLKSWTDRMELNSDGFEFAQMQPVSSDLVYFEEILDHCHILMANIFDNVDLPSRVQDVQLPLKLVGSSEHSDILTEAKGRRNVAARTYYRSHCIYHDYYFDIVRADEDYYIDVFRDQVHIDHDTHCNLDEVMKHQVPWDPGGSTRHRLEGKPKIKEGGMLATIPIVTVGWTMGSFSWAWAYRKPPKAAATYTKNGLTDNSAWNGRLRPPQLLSPSSSSILLM